MTERRPHAADSDSAEVYDPPVGGVELGTYEADAGSGYVWVERDRTGKNVQARYDGYPEEFEFRPGDETGIELVDGEWRTMPSVVTTIQLWHRVEWWTRNRRTGEFRFLAQMRLETPPPPQDPEPFSESQRT